MGPGASPQHSLSSTRPELAGTFGMVASTHWLASQTGMGVLERGGNAFDAAVATGFVLQVVEPHLNGPGGDLPIVLWSADDGRPHVVCGQGPAPQAATPTAYADLGLETVPGTGLLAATVPGAFGAWTLMLQRWGTWRLRDVLEPAIGYARDGVPTIPGIAATLDAVAPMFREHWATSAATYLTNDAAPGAWSRLRLPALADTYERLVREGEAAGPGREQQLEGARAAWYDGFVADAIDTFCRETAWRDTSGRAHGGLLCGDDLAAWRPTVEEPVTARYGDVEVAKTGPWGQGPVLLQALTILDGLGLGDLHEVDPDWSHLVLEASKLAFADREAWYGDPDHVDVPLDTLLSAAYADERRRLVDGSRASLDVRPGSPDGRTPQLPELPAATEPDTGAGVGEPTVRTGQEARATGDTCHVDVVDRWGNMVSATPSGGWLQSSPVIPELGFPLGTRAQMFWLQDGLASSLRPGARPRTTLSPSLALRDGRPWIAFGTPGGDRQDQWSLVLVLRMIHAAERDRDSAGVWTGLQHAIDSPMFHHEHVASSFHPRHAEPGVVVAESRLPAAVQQELRRRGHDLRVVDGWSLGRLSAVAQDGGWLRAAANPRGAQGYAVGR